MSQSVDLVSGGDIDPHRAGGGDTSRDASVAPGRPAATPEAPSVPVDKDGTSTLLGRAIYRLYGLCKRRRVRQVLSHVVARHEGGQMFSATLRRIFSTYHKIDIGMYTHGGCFLLGRVPPGTVVGRYCSLALTARVHHANHPMNLKSTHGLFYDPALGVATERIVPCGKLVVGNDVWIGHNAIILPSVGWIGDGAVIGAGSVVHKNIPPYAVVTGNPGRVVRYRFGQDVIDELLASRWWERPIDELRPDVASFQTPLEGGPIR